MYGVPKAIFIHRLKNFATFFFYKGILRNLQRDTERNISWVSFLFTTQNSNI